MSIKHPATELSDQPPTANLAEECRLQSHLAAKADMADTDMQQFMDEALTDIDGWTG